MGVRQLETLMKKFVPGGFVRVSLIEACLKFKNEHNELPILVIDLLGFVSVLTSDDFWTLCGGRFNKYREIFEDHLRKLSEHAKLVFFEDGPVVDAKLSTWIRRHSEKYRDCFALMQKIYDGNSLREVMETKHFKGKNPQIARLAPTEMMESIARQYGEVKVTFTRECDSEIARYAYNNPKVLAILADDSDFLIYSGHWRYFSIQNINFKTLETFEYGRSALRTFLNVNDKELVIVSTLNGNDIINYEKVRDNFHVKMDPFKHRFVDFRFPKLAECARKISLLPDKEIFAKIHQFIGFGSEELVEKSFEMYNPVFDIVELTDLHQFCHDNYFMFTYAVLLNSPITFTVAYFDLSLDNDIFDAKVEIFEKQIGIILANMPERRSMGYEIVTKKTHVEDYRSHWVQPKKFDDIPPLPELLDRSRFPEYDEIRLKLLKFMIGPIRLKNYDFRSFPVNYLQDILTLVTLRHYKFIAQFEADLIFLTIKHVETSTIPEDIQVPPLLNEKAFRTSFLFIKFHKYIDRCFQVIGLSSTMAKIINFDGVLFHTLYLKYLNQQFDIPQLLGSLRQYRIYR